MLLRYSGVGDKGPDKGPSGIAADGRGFSPYLPRRYANTGMSTQSIAGNHPLSAEKHPISVILHPIPLLPFGVKPKGLLLLA